MLAMSSLVLRRGWRSQRHDIELQLGEISSSPYTSVMIPAMWNVCMDTLGGGLRKESVRGLGVAMMQLLFDRAESVKMYKLVVLFYALF